MDGWGPLMTAASRSWVNRARRPLTSLGADDAPWRNSSRPTATVIAARRSEDALERDRPVILRPQHPIAR